ncbi:hypothetical protein Tco_0925900 [Tanacetum coccineum]|uniref:RING-type E3 ubiquitin transferase n=1 Tax=Tanacetum coccineum TaxID=301880 RepID=A0ABQ5D863_9ASTR
MPEMKVVRSPNVEALKEVFGQKVIPLEDEKRSSQLERDGMRHKIIRLGAMNLMLRGDYVNPFPYEWSILVFVEVHHLEMGCIEKGIVSFILKHNVRRLVMGSATDKHYSRKMVDLRSSKAIYVRSHAAASCQIQFVCKGNIIFTRQVLSGQHVHIVPTKSSPSAANQTDTIAQRRYINSFSSNVVLSGKPMHNVPSKSSPSVANQTDIVAQRSLVTEIFFNLCCKLDACYAYVGFIAALLGV